MKILVAGSIDYSDENSVLVLLQLLQRVAAGEVITIVTPIPSAVGSIVERLARAGSEDGLEHEEFDHDWSNIDRVFLLQQEGFDNEVTDDLLHEAREREIPVLEFFDSLSRNFSR